MTYTAMILDFDGTVLDSMDMWSTVGEHYLTSLGIQDIPHNLSNILLPMGLKQSACYLKDNCNVPLTTEEIITGINNIVENEYAQHLQLKPGVQEFLVQTKSIKKCIATETYKPFVISALNRLGIADFFDFIITAPEIGKGKKYADIFIYAAKKLDSPIHTTLVFEDALYAMQTAKQAGFPVCAVAEKTYADVKTGISQTAHYSVEYLLDFLTLVKK